MPAVLAGILEILGVMNTLNTFIQTILSLLGQPAQQPTLTQVLLAEQNNNGLIVQLGAADQLILTALSNIKTSLANQIGNPQQTGQPVTLPTTPPVGYGPPGGPALADAVWGFVNPAYPTYNMADELADAGAFARNLASISQMPHPYQKYVSFHYDYTTEEVSPPTASPPILDPTTILPSDVSILAWATRTEPFYVWALLNQQVVSYTNTLISDAWWIADISQYEFEQWRAGNVGKVTTAAPIWPGLANVTLGVTIALADGLNVPGPLDGVIVHITSVSYPISFYPFGTLKSFVKVGGLVFVDDNGQGEMAQPLGLEDDVVCPRTMVQADHALLRLQTGVVGTITPWVRS
jgi:hypothetical protein